MTRQEQIRFVEDLTQSIAVSVIKGIENGKAPLDWDGHELRELIADKAMGSRSRLMRGRSRRASAYRNTVLANNL